MVNRLHKIAARIAFFKWPSLFISLVLSGFIIFISLTSNTAEGDYYLMPSIAGLIWFSCLFGFIVNFRKSPPVINRNDGWMIKMKKGMNLGYYWLLSIFFIFATIALGILILRFILLWHNDYKTVAFPVIPDKIAQRL